MLTDTQWDKIKEFVPAANCVRPGHLDARSYLDGVLTIARTGRNWKDFPRRGRVLNDPLSRFLQWEKRGVWRRIAEALRDDEKLGPIIWKKTPQTIYAESHPNPFRQLTPLQRLAIEELLPKRQYMVRARPFEFVEEVLNVPRTANPVESLKLRMPRFFQRYTYWAREVDFWNSLIARAHEHPALMTLFDDPATEPTEVNVIHHSLLYSPRKAGGVKALKRAA